jgi:hypothetical protein
MECGGLDEGLVWVGEWVGGRVDFEDGEGEGGVVGGKLAGLIALHHLLNFYF